MGEDDRVGYDEFGMLHENAAEAGLAFDSPPEVRRVWVDVGAGRELSALVWGGDTPPPELVLLHGGAQNAHTWDTVCLALGPRSMVAVDLPGHGHSADVRAAGGDSGDAGDRGGVRDREGTLRTMAEDVAALLRNLVGDAGRPRAVVGMSLGGLVAITLAELAPDLVQALVLVDILPGIAVGQGRHIFDFVVGPPSFPSFDELLARTVEHNPHRSVSSLRRGILHNAAQQPDGSWVWRHSRPSGGVAGRIAAELAPGDRLHPQLWSVLEGLDIPLLLARGMRYDSVLRDDDVADLRRRVPAAQVVPFDGAGHSIQGDKPVELAATIAQALA